MSLNWNIEKVRDYKQIKTDAEWPVTDCMIWATMAVGINNITEANADEFYRRLSLYEVQEGPWLIKDGKGSPMTLDDVKRRIGLTTNAGSLNKTEFRAKLARLNKITA